MTQLNIPSGRAMLAAEIYGQGLPVVFLHAHVCDSRMWRAQLDAVSAAHRAIAYDRRGYGGTRAHSEDFSAVADLMAVLDSAAGGQPAILVGCSLGGKIAIEAALKHPSRIRGLVLIAPNVDGAPGPIHSSCAAELLEQQRIAEDAGDIDRLNAIKARLWLDGPLAPEGRVAGPARQLFLVMNDAVLRNAPTKPNLDTAPTFHRLKEIRGPSLIAWGEFDFPHIQRRSSLVADTMPSASSRVVSNAAHLPSLDQPEFVSEMIASFLARL